MHHRADTVINGLRVEVRETMTDLNETAENYINDLERGSMWLTDYAQDKKDCQELINITITINRAVWLIRELLKQ